MKNSQTTLAALALSLLIAPPAEAQSMGSAAASALAGFGTAVAVADGVVFVGEGANVIRPGMVYVYQADANGVWAEAARLTAPDAVAGDGFGVSLAAEGDLLLVGQDGGEGGRVHVFRNGRGGWERTTELRPDDLPDGSGYGASLAVSSGVVAVGAVGVGEGAGRVYLFRRTSGGWEASGWVEAEEPRSGDGFGSAIDVDGTRMLVGAPGRSDEAGVALVFRQDPGTGEWSQEAVLEGRGAERGSGFGASVVLGAGTALVAAPGHQQAMGAVFDFGLDAVEGEWRERTRLLPFDGGRSARFGSAMAVGPGGVYVGAPGAGEAGTIYVLRRANGLWVGTDKLVSERVAAGGDFGASLAMGGSVAVVGATGEDFGAGAAVILTRTDGRWREVEKLKSEPESLAAVTGSEARCEAGEAAGMFECADVDLLSFLPVTDMGGDRGVRVNDIWGWTDPATDREYALVGRIDGTSFVDVTDPVNPRYLGDLPMTRGSNAAVWRDIKVYANHALVVADGAGQHGMQVFDLTRLRNVREPVTFDEDAYYDRIASAHNVVVDTASGFAFAVGARGGGETCGGGLHMIDVRSPKSPTFAGCFADAQTGRASTGYTHDAQCVTYQGPDEDFRGREICLGANETALSIADVTDKGAPVALARATYPNVGYAHQGWLTEDQRYFFMNDELDELQGKTPRTRTLIWDVSELRDPLLVGEYLGTTPATDHNLYIRGTLMYQSNYQAGLQIIDISDPENPRQVGHFDTAPFAEPVPGFGGSWSNYPYFPSGIIVVTSGNEGLFVLRRRGPIS